MIKYKNRKNPIIISFETEMKDFEKDLDRELKYTQNKFKDFDINIEEIKVNSIIVPESSVSYAKQKQNVIVIATLLKKEII